MLICICYHALNCEYSASLNVSDASCVLCRSRWPLKVQLNRESTKRVELRLVWCIK